MNNATVEMLNKRDLDKCVVILNCITINLYMVEGNDYINERKIYMFYEIGLNGKRRFVSSVLENEKTKASEWYEYFQKLKARKVEKIIFAVLPKVKEMKDALKLAYKDVEQFESFDNAVDKLGKYTSFNHFYEIYKGLRKLYLAQDEEEYQLNFNEFKDKYKNYPFIMDLLGRDLDDLKVNYKYSYSVRRIIYEFNHAFEARKMLNTFARSQAYEKKEDYIQKILSYIRNSERITPYSKKEWLDVINEIYILKKDTLTPYLE